MAVPPRLQPLVQVLELPFEALLVLLLRDAIDPYRRIFPDASEGPLQRLFIEKVRQRVEPYCRV